MFMSLTARSTWSTSKISRSRLKSKCTRIFTPCHPLIKSVYESSSASEHRRLVFKLWKRRLRSRSWSTKWLTLPNMCRTWSACSTEPSSTLWRACRTTRTTTAPWSSMRTTLPPTCPNWRNILTRWSSSSAGTAKSPTISTQPWTRTTWSRRRRMRATTQSTRHRLRTSRSKRTKRILATTSLPTPRLRSASWTSSQLKANSAAADADQSA